jgi:chaperone LolA
MALLAILLVLLPAAQRPGSGVDDLIQGVNKTYARLADFSAAFEQISVDPSNQRQVQRGLLYLSRTGKKMRFEYQVPEKRSYYSDGKTYTQYVPAAKQAVQWPVGKAVDERLQIFQVLVGSKEWREQYPRYEEKRSETALRPGNRVVQMLPRKSDLPDVLLEIDPVTFLIHRFSLEYTDGERNEYRFADVKTTKLDPATFTFNPPPGTDVVQER